MSVAELVGQGAIEQVDRVLFAQRRHRRRAAVRTAWRCSTKA